MNLPRALLIKIIRLYQAVTVRRLPVCRFDPSCSSYAIEAVSQHGASKGAWYAMRRIARCHPWLYGALVGVALGGVGGLGS